MPNYRRYRVPGGTYFFTVNLLERRQDTLVRHIDALREAVRKTRRERPFHIDLTLDWVGVIKDESLGYGELGLYDG
jgi:REP element-mobilizing transposase RayT